MTKYLLLDVDGVLNPDFTDSWEDDFYNQGWRRVQGFIMNARPVWVNITHGEKLQKTAANAGAQLAWATRWNDMANMYLAPLIGLPQLPVIATDPQVPKSQTVISALQGQRGVWLDDDQENEIVVACANLPNLDVVQVDPYTGLTNAELTLAGKLLG